MLLGDVLLELAMNCAPRNGNLCNIHSRKSLLLISQQNRLDLEKSRTMIAVRMPLWMALVEISIKPGKLSASSATHMPSR
jgi:hypothetical protein